MNETKALQEVMFFPSFSICPARQPVNHTVRDDPLLPVPDRERRRKTGIYGTS